MNVTQLVNFELAPGCPYAMAHPFCPSKLRSLPSRRLSDNAIVNTAAELYLKQGFSGLIGFHYYNEPFRHSTRLELLMMFIKAKVPQARFLLWSNLAEHVAENNFPYQLFEVVYLSIYAEHSKDAIDSAMKNVSAKNPNLKIHWPDDDKRTTPQRGKGNEPCFRPYLEMTIDNAGEIRLCCHDWEGTSAVGNILDEPLDLIVKEWQVTRRQAAIGDPPRRCRACPFRYKTVNCIDTVLCKKAKQHARELKNGSL